MERQWGSSEARICSECIDERALKDAIRAVEDVEEGESCTFCGRETAAPFDELLEVFADGIRFLYDDALNSVPYVSSEGGFVGADVIETWELVEEFLDCFEENVADKVVDELRECMDMVTWVSRTDPDYGPQATLEQAWQLFAEAIKHETRYVFWLQEEREEGADRYGWDANPAAALNRVAELIDQLQLFREYDAGYIFHRARTYEDQDKPPADAKALGTPPRSVALQGNRMSPAGIPMFYGAEAGDVALAEVSVRTENRLASVGKFLSTAPFKVVDLTDLPRIPSPFDPARREFTWMVSFLHDFVERISQPIEKGRDQVDYVPTQVMTEYLLRIHWGRGAIRGIRYPSRGPQRRGVCRSGRAGQGLHRGWRRDECGHPAVGARGLRTLRIKS